MSTTFENYVQNLMSNAEPYHDIARQICDMAEHAAETYEEEVTLCHDYDEAWNLFRRYESKMEAFNEALHPMYHRLEWNTTHDYDYVYHFESVDMYVLI